MKAIQFIFLIFFFGSFFGCDKTPPETQNKTVSIIPKPQKMVKGKGFFKLKADQKVYYDPEFTTAVNFLRNYLHPKGSVLQTATDKTKAQILFESDTTLSSEAYSLKVSPKRIQIAASDAAGAFYAVQSLRQMLPVSLEDPEAFEKVDFKIQAIAIQDKPRFKYRGMHLDVARHFFPKEFIKEYISYLAMLKMNTFHWHLTEDQGWRIEIKQFPGLTTHAAFRDETLIGHYNDSPQKFDGMRYGGFYTQEDVKEIVAFAAEHHITIIPEIEMPGHAQAAISAYPELGCGGKNVPVATKWGVFENIFCPNQKTFAFLQGVLTEVIDLFPGEYIHIGGDEAPKVQWKKCSHCQKLIRQHKLKDEHGLQSWFIKEIETFVNSKGKKIIGWDEILEGGLAPNATVMSWRGIQGGIDAAKAGHDVIMTPMSHAYFDYYQSDEPNEPLAIGGYLPLKKVYGFNPVPKELSKEQSQYILGAQGNVWTEYMKTEAQVQYMIFPRILAMSEVVWSGPTKNLEADYPDFVHRVESFNRRLEALEINAANHLYTIEGKIVKKDSLVTYELDTPTKGKEIRYSINEEGWVSYKNPIVIVKNSDIKAAVLKNGERLSDTFSESIRYHKAVPAKIAMNIDPHPSYSAGGKDALINGIRGSDSRYGDSEWLGFWGDDLEIVINFKQEMELNTIQTRFYHAPGQWIYAPKTLKVSGRLNDGGQFLTTAQVEIDPLKNTANLRLNMGHLKQRKYKSIKLSIPSFGIIPRGKQGAGNKAWTFIDEIIIE